jgi:hypothetical protein
VVVRYLQRWREVGVLALGDDDAYEARQRRLEDGDERRCEP